MVETTFSMDLLELSVEVVAAYVSYNSVPSGELPGLIGEVHLVMAHMMEPEAPHAAEPLRPAVPARKSVTGDFIICLEDGKKFKSLKRHLRTQYDMSPEQYREKWGLGTDYPMVAPNYARARSQLAKEMGLGQQRRKRA